ncbi:MAG: J domain-containing protein [Paludibacteraceae bacterium]|nr:J domain-containing protein [Paludibacteraceae bacterium]
MNRNENIQQYKNDKKKNVEQSLTRNDIVRQYKQVKAFQLIFKGMDLPFRIVLKILFSPICIVAWMLHDLSNLLIYSGVGALVSFFFLGIFSSTITICSIIVFAVFMTSMVLFISLLGLALRAHTFDEDEKRSRRISDKMFAEWKSLTNFHYFSNSFTNEIIKENYEPKWGMTEEQIKEYISRRWNFGNKKSISLYVLPLFSQLCRLNKKACGEQVAFLSNLLSEEEIKLVMEREYSDVQIEEATQHWRGKIMNEKMFMMNTLFQLSVEVDGIHNDEWKLLMMMMSQFGILDIESFIRKYSPLRTEFDNHQYKNNKYKNNKYKYKNTTAQDRESAAKLRPYYTALGLTEDASVEEIKRAYHALVQLHHPDKPQNVNRIVECETLMKRFNEAYEHLRKKK